MKRGCRKQLTDEQIAKLKSWKRGDKPPLYRLAMDIGMSSSYASSIRTGWYERNTPRDASRKRSDQPHAGHQVVLDAPSASVRIPVADQMLTSTDTGSACRVASRYEVTPGVGGSRARGRLSEECR